MRIDRHPDQPPRTGLTWDELWADLPTALISCWDRGREKAKESPELAAACKRGELPLLPWAGGVEKPLKAGRKAGSLQYLAMWQGLCGAALAVDTAETVCLVCSRTGVSVWFTSDIGAISRQTVTEENEGE